MAFCKFNFPILVTMKLKIVPHLLITIAMLFMACSLTYLQSEDAYILDEGILYYEEGRYGEALTIFSDFISQYKYSDLIDKGWYYKGITELQLAEDSITEVIISEDYFRKAIESFNEVSSISKYCPESILGVGYCYYSLNEFSSARKCFTKIISNYSSSNQIDNACLYIGHTYRKELMQDTAIIWYEKIITQYMGSSSYDNALYWAGDYYFVGREDTLKREKALAYLKEYCKLTEISDPQYYLAKNKIEVMENE